MQLTALLLAHELLERVLKVSARLDYLHNVCLILHQSASPRQATLSRTQLTAPAGQKSPRDQIKQTLAKFAKIMTFEGFSLKSARADGTICHTSTRL